MLCRRLLIYPRSTALGGVLAIAIIISGVSWGAHFAAPEVGFGVVAPIRTWRGFAGHMGACIICIIYIMIPEWRRSQLFRDGEEVSPEQVDYRNPAFFTVENYLYSLFSGYQVRYCSYSFRTDDGERVTGNDFVVVHGEGGLSDKVSVHYSCDNPARNTVLLHGPQNGEL